MEVFCRNCLKEISFHASEGETLQCPDCKSVVFDLERSPSMMVNMVLGIPMGTMECSCAYCGKVNRGILIRDEYWMDGAFYAQTLDDPDGKFHVKTQCVYCGQDYRITWDTVKDNELSEAELPEDDLAVIANTLQGHFSRMQDYYGSFKLMWPLWNRLITGEILDFTTRKILVGLKKAIETDTHVHSARLFEGLYVCISVIPKYDKAIARQYFKDGYEVFLDEQLTESGYGMGEIDFAHWIFCYQPEENQSISLTYIPSLKFSGLHEGEVTVLQATDFYSDAEKEKLAKIMGGDFETDTKSQPKPGILSDTGNDAKKKAKKVNDTWLEKSSLEKHCTQMIVGLSNNDAVKAAMDDFTARSGLAVNRDGLPQALDVLSQEDDLVILIKGEGLTEYLLQGKILLALAFYQMDHGAIFQIFGQVDHPELAERPLPFIVEHHFPVDERSYRIRRLLLADYLLVHIVEAEHGRLIPAKSYRMPIPARIKERLLGLFTELENYHNSLRETENHQQALEQYQRENPVQTSPLLISPSEMDFEKRQLI